PSSHHLSSGSFLLPSVGLHKYFDRLRMAQEACWASAATVRSGLKHGNQVADLSFRQINFVAQQIQWRTQTAHDRYGSRLPLVDLVSDDKRIVPPDDLAKVARGGELMMQATVDDQVGPTSRLLPVDHARHVNTALANN